jgi:tail tube protein gp19
MQQAGVTPKSLHQRWQFGIEIGGFEVGFFTTASEVSVSNAVVEFNPAGSISAQKAAGRMTWDDVTLEKGWSQESAEDAALLWQRDIARASQGTGGLPADYMRELDIVEYDRTGREIRRFRLYYAFIQKISFSPAKDGSSSDNSIQQVVIAYNYADAVL